MHDIQIISISQSEKEQKDELLLFGDMFYNYNINKILSLTVCL
jgi:hypothetical protein